MSAGRRVPTDQNKSCRMSDKLKSKSTGRDAGALRGNPFVSVSWHARLALIVYVLLYNVFTPGLSEILYGPLSPLAGGRLLAEILYQLLLFGPILFYRSSWGWLHPLVFLVVFDLGTSLARNTGQLLSPFFLLLREPSADVMQHRALSGWTPGSVARAKLKAKLLQSLSLICYYSGFFLLPRPSIPSLRFPQPRHVRQKVLVFVALAGVAFLWFVQSSGGLTAHFTKVGLQKQELIGGQGPILVLIQVGMIACLVWFALVPSVLYNPLFWGITLSSIAAIFLSNGSRSSVVYSVMLFGMVWMISHRKVPYLRAFAFAIVALVLVGGLGNLRQSSWSSSTNQVDWTVITDLDLSRSLAAAEKEMEFRERNNGFLAVVGKVPDETGLLWGRSYLGVLTFAVPRALWHGKPKGAGVLNRTRNFNEPNRGGIPPGSVGEAYWNFHVPGVAIIFALYGIFHRWLAGLLRWYPRKSAVWVIYVILLFHMSPMGIDAIEGLQQVIPAVALLWWVGALSFAKSR